VLNLYLVFYLLPYRIHLNSSLHICIAFNFWTTSMISVVSIIFLLRFSPATKSVIATSRWFSLTSVPSDAMKSLWPWTFKIDSKASLLVLYSGVCNFEALYRLLVSSTWTLLDYHSVCLYWVQP
jgi:hypothetical protein